MRYDVLGPPNSRPLLYLHSDQAVRPPTRPRIDLHPPQAKSKGFEPHPKGEARMCLGSRDVDTLRSFHRVGASGPIE